MICKWFLLNSKSSPFTLRFLRVRTASSVTFSQNNHNKPHRKDPGGSRQLTKLGTSWTLFVKKHCWGEELECVDVQRLLFLEGSISIFIHPYPVHLPHPIPLLLSPHPHSLLPLTLRCHILCSFPVLPPYLFPLSFSCSRLPFPILFSSHSIGSCWSELAGSCPLLLGLGGPSLWLLAQPEIHSLAASWLLPWRDH